MRLCAALLLVTATLCLSAAHADEGFVVDTSEAAGKVYSFADGELKVEDEPQPDDLGPLVAISLQSESGGEVSIWQFHKDEKGFTVGLSKPGTAYDPSPADGVMQITNLSVSSDHPELSPELEAMLLLGKRYVIDNIELVIYAPWCTSFRAYLLGANSKAERPVLGWIQGSLGELDQATIPVL